MSTIDTLDERILSELKRNGRVTIKGQDKRVGVCSQAMIKLGRPLG